MLDGFGDNLAPSTARLGMRLTPAALAKLREAAILRQQDLTSFVLGSALDRASEILALERGAPARGAPRSAAPEPEPELPRDPDDPDDELWDDYRVTREHPVLRQLIFDALKGERQEARERGLPIPPVDFG